MKRILIIEQDADVLALLESVLRYAHYDVRSAHTGSYAAQIVRCWQPHAILADILPQRFAEFETILILRNEGRAYGVPIVMMTSRSDLNTQRARELGYAGFVAKPFSIRILLREIASVAEGTFDIPSTRGLLPAT